MTPPTTGDRGTEQLKQLWELYRRLISPEAEVENEDRLVAFDTVSEDFVIGDDLIEMCHQLKARHPDAKIVGCRVGGGGRAVDRFRGPRRVILP